MSFIEETTTYTSRQLSDYSPPNMPRFGDYLASPQMSQTGSQKSPTSFGNTSTGEYFEPEGLLSW